MVVTYSPNPEINATIQALLDLGLPPLPVAPKQDPRNPGCHHQTWVDVRFNQDDRHPEIQGAYCRLSLTKVGDDRAPVKGNYCRLDENLEPIPRFTGKNPSYLDRDGTPRSVQHRTYQDRPPTEAELKAWFAHPNTGIGTLGGHKGVDWLDFDRKNYESQEDWDRDVEFLLERTGETWVERTGSGGWRVAVRPEDKPTFTNFSTEPSGDRHIGEALYQGRFTVLAPSIHPNGTPYRRIGWAEPVSVPSLQSIGIYPTRDEIANLERAEKRKQIERSGKTHAEWSSPYDMREMAEYLEGFRVEGDYIECKCPAHNGTTDNSLNVHIETGKFWCWAGCDLSKVFQTTKRIALSEGYLPSVVTGDRPKSATIQPISKTEGTAVMAEMEEDKKRNIKREFPQIAAHELYSDTRYISVAGKLYRWTGTHYEYCPDELEEKRIAQLADTTPVIKKTRAKDENGNPIYEVTYPYATSQKVNQALAWIKVLNAVSIDKCNPPGLNCKNGVLQISYSDRTPIFNFVPHSPDMYYLYEPMVEYNPDAYAEDCDRLLSALDKPQQQVFLRTIAAALDIEKVRESHGRIKALLAYGDGSNGKDSLRETVSLLWGRTGMTSLGTQDFAGYDGGRKFTLILLPGSRINWSSENKKDVNLDSSEALKQAISGDELHLERKGVDPEPFTPKAVHIFNINHTPNIKAGMEAIKSRFAIVSFLKTFKIGANPELGEIEADPRFKYSKDFIQVNILPAFLNKIMDAFRALMEEGIDYSCCDAALEEAQSVNSHLFEFSKVYKLVADKNNTIPVKELWDKLEEFYKAGDTPILRIDSYGNRIWDNDVRPGDPYVKGANQIYNRISKLFPRAKLVSIGNNRKGIQGIAFADELTAIATPPPEPPPPQTEPEPEPQQKELVPVGATVPQYKPGDKVQCSKGSGIVVSVNCTTATIEGDTFYGPYPITELRLL